MSSEPKKQYTLAEYFEIDRNSEVKYEYWQGEIFAMTGASKEHNQISINLTRELGIQLKNRACSLFPSDQRIKTPNWPPYRYPDLTALCGEPTFEVMGGLDILLNPTLIIEILSPTTEAFDRGSKFTYYKSISSFCEYLLIAQYRPHVTQFVKQADNKWLQSEFSDMKDSIYLSSINCTLTLNEIYWKIDFESVEQPAFPKKPLEIS